MKPGLDDILRIQKPSGFRCYVRVLGFAMGGGIFVRRLYKTGRAPGPKSLIWNDQIIEKKEAVDGINSPAR